MWLDILGGRKFVLALVSLGTGAAVSILSPKGLSPELVALILGSLGAFSASNAVLSHKAMSSSSEEPAGEDPQPAVATPEPVDLSPIYAVISELSSAVGETKAKAEAHDNALLTMQAAVDTAQKVARAAVIMKQG